MTDKNDLLTLSPRTTPTKQEWCQALLATITMFMAYIGLPIIYWYRHWYQHPTIYLFYPVILLLYYRFCWCNITGLSQFVQVILNYYRDSPKEHAYRVL